MAPTVVKGLIGGSNPLVSPNASLSRSINLYPERTDPDGKVPQTLRNTPGLHRFAEVDDTPSYGLFYQDGRAFGVTGTTFFEVFDDGTTQTLGTVAEDDTPATFASNGSAGNQLMIVAGGEGYIFNLSTGVFTRIIDVAADFPSAVLMCEFMDGYFLVPVVDSRRFYISALEDGLSWDALDWAERSEGSDNISFLKRSHREIWLVGTKTGEVWYDNGDADFPFAPIQGVFLEHGCVAPWSVTRIEGSLMWLDQTERGGCLVVRANGYQPEAVSTYAVDRILARGSGTLESARAFAQQWYGHVFYWIHVADNDARDDQDIDTTWVLDVTEGLWHERAQWEETEARWFKYLAITHTYAFERHLVGDRDSGLIYEMSDLFYQDEL